MFTDVKLNFMEHIFYTIREVMEMFRCGRSLIGQLIAQRILAPVQIASRKRLIPAEQIEAYGRYVQETPIIFSLEDTKRIIQRCAPALWLSMYATVTPQGQAVCPMCFAKGTTLSLSLGNIFCSQCNYNVTVLDLWCARGVPTLPLAYQQIKKFLAEENSRKKP